MSGLSPPSAKINHISRHELYRREKPYVLDSSFDANGLKKTNRITEARDVKMRDIRGLDDYGLDSTGWTYLHAPTSLSTIDFDDPDIIGSKYYDEVAALLQAQFPQYSSIAILDHVIRKRSPAFPTQVGAVTAAEQPLSLAHADFSTEGARLRTEGYRSLGQVGKNQAYDMLNVWRLIRPGPNNDWPLGLCDWRTVDVEDDVIDNDVVFEGSATENTLLYYNPKHQWCWKSDMGMDDVIVLCNASSEGRLRARAFHAALEVPQYSPDIRDLRQSIEVRVAVFLR